MGYIQREGYPLRVVEGEPLKVLGGQNGDRGGRRAPVKDSCEKMLIEHEVGPLLPNIWSIYNIYWSARLIYCNI